MYTATFNGGQTAVRKRLKNLVDRVNEVLPEAKVQYSTVASAISKGGRYTTYHVSEGTPTLLVIEAATDYIPAEWAKN